jgi:hypothetical protein
LPASSVLLACIVFSSILVLSPSAATAISTGSLSGLVTDDDPTAPVPLGNICLEIYDADPAKWDYDPVARGETSDGSGGSTTGEFLVTNVPPGEYLVLFLDCGDGAQRFRTEWHTSDGVGTKQRSSASIVSVSDGNETGGVDGALGRTAGLEGVVTLQGDPSSGLEGISVYAFLAVSPQPEFWDYVSWAPTDENGVYSMHGLEPGDYKILFSDDSDGSKDYVDEWYEESGSFAAAEALSLSPGETAMGISGTLETGGAIAGVVTEQGAPSVVVSSACVEVYATGQPDPDDLDVTTHTGTLEDGTFRAGGLPPGTYKVRFSDCHHERRYLPEWHAEAGNYASASVVTVSSTGTSTVNANLQRGGSIEGNVSSSDSPPFALPGICVEAWRDGTFVNQESTDGAGHYDIGGLATGTYRIRFSDCGFPKDYASEWWSDAHSMQEATDIAVVTGQPTTGKNAVLGEGGSLSGTVTDEAGVGLSSVCVDVHRYQAGSGTGPFIERMGTAPGGAYEVSGLRPGQYEVRFVDGCGGPSDYLEEWYDEQVSEDTANPVTVAAESETVGVDGTLAADVPEQFELTVSATASGMGTGTVSSSPEGIAACGPGPSGDCSGSYDAGTPVLLTAAPGSTSRIASWTGCATRPTPSTCSVTMDQARSVSVAFAPARHTLTVQKDGGGTGSVTSSPIGITCGDVTPGPADCAQNYNHGTVVSLTADAAVGSSFTSWTGPCAGSLTDEVCQVTMSAARSVIATFGPPPTHLLSVSKQGTGTGSVTSAPAGISCGATCGADFDEGDVVTLTAASAGDSLFSGWSGAGCSGTGTCVVTMADDRDVTATFERRPPISKSLTLVASPARVKKGKRVTLTATLTPCTSETQGDPIEIAGDSQVGGPDCAVSVTLKVKRMTTFIASSPADEDSSAATSNPVTVTVKKPKNK